MIKTGVGVNCNGVYAPTAKNLFFFLLAILTLESAGSIRFLYKHFLSKISDKSLNTFYYVCSYANIDYSRFMNITANIAVNLIPRNLGSQPVFLCIDDTMVPKSGKKFEDVSKLFDHAAHNGSNYLNGHCFVSVMLCVPVWNQNRIRYVCVPLGYRMWLGSESKLKLAASMVRQVMPELTEKKNVILLCDSWYVKKDLVCLVDEYENLDLVGSARADSVIYDLAPEPSGKKGRPAVHGRRLSIQDDFILSDEKIGDYFMSARRVLTNVFGKRKVMAYVTVPKRDSDSRRLFFSTVLPEQLQIFCAWQEKSPLNQTGSGRMQFIPLLLYVYRWNIEVSYYEQKTFWSLCGYMVRSRKGIEMLVNLINIAYCAMKILPYQDNVFLKYRTESVQEFRFVLSTQIREQVFYAIFAKNIETYIKSNTIINALKQLIQQQGYHL